MILANRSGRVLLEVQRAELTAHPDIADNIAYSVQFGEQILHGNHRLSHRDLLNPVFNEVLPIIAEGRPLSSCSTKAPR